MGRLRDYTIPFAGLREGRHDYDFKIDNAFFALFKDAEITEGCLDATVVLDKKSNFFELTFGIRGKVAVTCDRCLDAFDMPIECSKRLFFRFGDKSHEQTDEIIILAAHEYEIQLAQYFYEYIHLALPYQKIHPGGEGNSCNREMMHKLESVLVDGSSANPEDPRWEKLKDINLKKSDKNGSSKTQDFKTKKK